MRKKVKLSEIFKVHSEKSMLKTLCGPQKKGGGKQGVKQNYLPPKKNLTLNEE